MRGTRYYIVEDGTHKAVTPRRGTKLPKWERWLVHAVLDGLEDGHTVDDIAVDTGTTVHEVAWIKTYIKRLVGKETTGRLPVGEME